MFVRSAEPERGPRNRVGNGAAHGTRRQRSRVGQPGRRDRQGSRRQRGGGDGVRHITDRDDEDHEPGGRRHTRGAGGRPAQPPVPHTGRSVAVRDIREGADRAGRGGRQRDTVDRRRRLSDRSGNHGAHNDRGHGWRHRQDTRSAVRRIQISHLGHCSVQGVGHAVLAQVRAHQLQRDRPQWRDPPSRLFRKVR